MKVTVIIVKIKLKPLEIEEEPIVAEVAEVVEEIVVEVVEEVEEEEMLMSLLVLEEIFL